MINTVDVWRIQEVRSVQTNPLAPPITFQNRYKTTVYNAQLTKYCFAFLSEYIVVV